MTTSLAPPPHAPGRALAAVGLALPFLGVVGYAGQLAAQRLTAPWYLPVAATLGVVCHALALWQHRTVWRGLGLLLAVLVCGAAWLFLLAAAPLPAYAGPLAEGKTFPTFATTRADGRAFTNSDLIGDRDTVMVFFRGRW
jgi:hypothetical protein